MSDMGIFRTTVAIAPLTDQDSWREIDGVMVDTGSEYNWLPRSFLAGAGITVKGQERFQTADGRLIVRDIGWVLYRVAGRVAPSIVVFAEETDLVLLGAVALESLNLRIDLAQRQLVHAGPVPAAAA